MKTLQTCHAIFGFGIMLLATPAIASDYRFAPSHCSYTGYTTGTFSKAYNKFQNTSGSDKNVICPAMLANADYWLDRAYINVSSSVGETACRLWLRHTDGSAEGFLPDGEPDTSYPGRTVYWWGDGISFDMRAGLRSLPAFQCTLPDSAWIAGYYFDAYHL